MSKKKKKKKKKRSRSTVYVANNTEWSTVMLWWSDLGRDPKRRSSKHMLFAVLPNEAVDSNKIEQMPKTIQFEDSQNIVREEFVDAPACSKGTCPSQTWKYFKK